MKLGKCLSLLFLDNKTAEVRFDLTFGLADLPLLLRLLLLSFFFVMYLVLYIYCSKEDGSSHSIKKQNFKVLRYSAKNNK